jgi:hypothetical protein
MIIHHLERSAMGSKSVYTVVVVRMGKRGTHHADGFQKNGRFRLA